MLIGYVRVSTPGQSTQTQEEALQKAGCEKIFIDKVSGTTADRPQLNRLRDMLRKGDVLTVCSLDRLGRSLKDLTEWMNHIEQQGVIFKSLRETIDTSTAAGKLVFHVFASLAEFERNLIRERTKAGLETARARGRLGGRPKSLSEEDRKLAVRLYRDKQTPVAKICEMMKISKPTLYEYVREMKDKD